MEVGGISIAVLATYATVFGVRNAATDPFTHEFHGDRTSPADPGTATWRLTGSRNAPALVARAGTSY